MIPPPSRPPAERGEPRRSLRDENRVAVRKAILDAAATIFGSQGFQAAKMTDIAQSAGVAAGTLYNYFASKEEVFAQIVARACERVQLALNEAQSIDDPLQRLQTYLRIPLAFIEDQGPLFAIQVQLTGTPDIGPNLTNHDALNHTPPDDEVRQLHFKLMLEAIVSAQEQGKLQPGPAEVMVLMLCGMVKSLVWNWLKNDRPAGLATQTDFVFNLFLHGAKTP